ncbi:FAD-dependent thymidylate synthase [Corynebacterium sp. HMSC08A12]|uniref:FAD-dependent thymidylate synthase n=1 Tax=Corynebacterium sp. HMSC08A12 TaxID=1581134 RepID=UPI0008A25B1D|nr:FAD-dependent thymidylate synthase [Corynebacterium sp. HMSC08A12]
MVNIVEPKVELIAHTTLANDGRSPVIENYMSLDSEGSDPQQLVEFAGRVCYQSFHKPNTKTARNKDYLNRTLHDQGHWSIAEHATATFYIIGVSRAFTHELIRHRHLSYSQLSQRFVDGEYGNIVMPPAVRDDDDLCHALELVAEECAHGYGTVANILQNELGLPVKQAREAARATLPNMTETRIVVTGNLRAWHEVIQRRTQPDADAEFQEVAGMIRNHLRDIAPAIFNQGDQ